MAAHPDGSGRAFLSTLDGKIWLASLMGSGTGATAMQVSSVPFLDLSDRVRYNAAQGLGLMGVAFHPGFAANGRFFVSYASNDRSNGHSSSPRRYQLVVAEFSAAKSGDDYAKAAHADPSQVRRIYSIGMPFLPNNVNMYNASFYYQQQHGGQLLFRPTHDGYLYLVTGNERSLPSSFLGKVIRFDIDRSDPMPAAAEIYAMGLSNPRGCSFDSDRPSDLYCANVDQEQNEGVLLISENVRNGSSSSAKATVSLVVGLGCLAAGSTAAPSIVGGLVYRGSADPALRGRYLYTFGSAVWAAVETPEKRSGPYASTLILPNIRCFGTNTTVPCPGGGTSIVGHVLSFGQDNSKDAFLLGTSGVYRLVRSGLCIAVPSSLPPPPPSPSAWLVSLGAFALAFALYQVYWTVFASNNGQAATRIEFCRSMMCCMLNVTNNNYYGRAQAP
ncbi:unnamed protein product [Urochloa humidicola]